MEIEVHYFQFNIGDYIKHTLHLSAEEDLTYRRLLDFYYDTESPIPHDFSLVARKIRMPLEVTEAIIKEFFDRSEDGWHNYRADQEIAKYHEFIDKQKSNGKLGGRPKKTHGYPKPNPNETQVEPKKTLTTNHKPLTTNQETENNKIHRRTAVAVACPLGVTEQVWADFIKVRKAKGKPITETALNGIINEAEKAGWSVDDALRESVIRGWLSFKAEWVNKPQYGNMINKQEALEARNRAVGDRWLAKMEAQDANIR